MGANEQFAFSRRDNWATQHRALNIKHTYILNVLVTFKMQNTNKYCALCERTDFKLSKCLNLSTTGQLITT